VCLKSPTMDAQIRYTIDGTEPNENSPIYTGPIDVSSNITLKVKAFKQGMQSSDTVTENYKLSSAYPESLHNYEDSKDEYWTYTVAGNPQFLKVTFSPQTKLEDRDEDGSAYDVLHIENNDENDIDGSPYAGTELAGKTVIISGDTLKLYFSTDEDTNDWGFKVDSIQPVNSQDDLSSDVKMPSIIPDSGNYNILKVLMSDEDEGSTIRYTMDGTEPDASSVKYTDPIKVNASCTLKAKAFKNDKQSYSITKKYTIYDGLPESQHTYDMGKTETWTYIGSGNSDYMDIKFDDKTEVNSDDKIYVMDSSWNNIEGSPFSGSSLKGKTVKVKGNILKIKLESSLTQSKWGFKINEIEEKSYQDINNIPSCVILGDKAYTVKYIMNIKNKNEVLTQLKKAKDENKLICFKISAKNGGKLSNITDEKELTLDELESLGVVEIDGVYYKFSH
jgi:hypothetical protein